MANEFKFLRGRNLPEVRILLAYIRRDLGKVGSQLIAVRHFQQLLRVNEIELSEEAIRSWRRRGFIKRRPVGRNKTKRIFLTIASILKFLDRLEIRAKEKSERGDIKKNLQIEPYYLKRPVEKISYKG